MKKGSNLKNHIYVFNMKKIFICLLVLLVFLTGCSQIQESKTESKTLAPSKEDVGNPGNNDVNSDSNYIYNCEAHKLFTRYGGNYELEFHA